MRDVSSVEYLKRIYMPEYMTKKLDRVCLGKLSVVSDLQSWSETVLWVKIN